MALSVVQTAVSGFLANGAITATLTAFTDVTDTPFSAGQVTSNPKIVVHQAGAASSDLATTIAAFVSTSAVTVAAPAGTTQTAASWLWGFGGDLGSDWSKTMTITPFLPVQEGDLFCVIMSYLNTSTISSVTDSSGNVYQLATGGNNGVNATAIYYAKNMKAAPRVTVTVNFATVSDFGNDVMIIHIRGADTKAPLDVADTNNAATGATLSSHAYTTAFQNEIIVAGTNGNSGMVSGQAGYTVGPLDPYLELYQYKIVNTIQANATTTATQISSNRWALSTVSFKAGSPDSYIRARMQPMGL